MGVGEVGLETSGSPLARCISLANFPLGLCMYPVELENCFPLGPQFLHVQNHFGGDFQVPGRRDVLWTGSSLAGGAGDLGREGT